MICEWWCAELMPNLAFFITNTDVHNLISACNLLKCNSMFKRIKRLEVWRRRCWWMYPCVFTCGAVCLCVRICTYICTHTHTKNTSIIIYPGSKLQWDHHTRHVHMRAWWWLGVRQCTMSALVSCSYTAIKLLSVHWHVYCSQNNEGDIVQGSKIKL